MSRPFFKSLKSNPFNHMSQIQENPNLKSEHKKIHYTIYDVSLLTRYSVFLSAGCCSSQSNITQQASPTGEPKCETLLFTVDLTLLKKSIKPNCSED